MQFTFEQEAYLRSKNFYECFTSLGNLVTELSDCQLWETICNQYFLNKIKVNNLSHHENRRSMAQKGIFIPCLPHLSMDESLSTLQMELQNLSLTPVPAMIKLNIPEALRQDITLLLREKDINERTLLLDSTLPPDYTELVGTLNNGIKLISEKFNANPQEYPTKYPPGVVNYIPPSTKPGFKKEHFIQIS